MCRQTIETKFDGSINQQNYNFNQFYTQNILISQNATIQQKSIVILGFSFVNLIEI